MLRIKLSRVGKKGQPSYRIVVNEKRDKRDGQSVEQVGFYNPSSTPKDIRFEKDLYEQWLKKGAQPTDTVAALYKKFTA
jgi:small subunit ribosomal protein S16